MTEDMTQEFAYRMLHHAGYRLVQGYKFKKPTPDHVVTYMEQVWVDALVHSFNFGGILCDSHTDVAGEKPMRETEHGFHSQGKEPELSLEQAKNLAAEGLYPKVTEASIKNKIAHVTYIEHRAGTTQGILTLCIIEMTNGFMVHGVSAAADPRNHKAEIGQRYAYENAFKQLWQLEGYLLRNRIAKDNHEAKL